MAPSKALLIADCGSAWHVSLWKEIEGAGKVAAWLRALVALAEA